MLSDTIREKHSSVAKVLVVILSLFFAALFLYLSLKRIFFPYEIEWMEGWIIGHASRIFHGQQLYVKPSIEFINWLYQPLYYYVTAAMMSLVGESYTAGRLVSSCSTIFSCGLIYLAIRKLTDRSLWLSLTGVAIYLGSNALIGYFFDIARIDSFAVMLILASVIIPLYRQNSVGIIGSAVLLALAVFTKQQAFIYLLPLLLWIFLLKGWKESFLFVSVFLLLFAAGTYLLYAANGEWYFYFVYTIPKSKAAGLSIIRMTSIFSDYLFSFYGIGMCVIIFSWISSRVVKRENLKTGFGLISITFLLTLIQLIFNLGDQYSYKNITMPLAAFFAIAFPASLWKLHVSQPVWRNFLPWLAFIQLLALLYNPRSEDLIDVREVDKQAAEHFMHELDSLKGNTILIASHSFVPPPKGVVQAPNFLAFRDVLLVGDSRSSELKESWDKAFRDHRFDIIIADESAFSHGEGFEGYSYAGMLNRTLPFVYRSRIGSSVTTPRYILKPSP